MKNLVTDPAKRQEIRNSIQEGMLILRSGMSHDRRLTTPELLQIRLSVEHDMEKLGESRLAGKFVGTTIKDVTPKGYGPEGNPGECILRRYETMARKRNPGAAWHKKNYDSDIEMVGMRRRQGNLSGAAFYEGRASANNEGVLYSKSQGIPNPLPKGPVLRAVVVIGTILGLAWLSKKNS